MRWLGFAQRGTQTFYKVRSLDDAQTAVIATQKVLADHFVFVWRQPPQDEEIEVVVGGMGGRSFEGGWHLPHHKALAARLASVGFVQAAGARADLDRDAGTEPVQNGGGDTVAGAAQSLDLGVELEYVFQIILGHMASGLKNDHLHFH